MSLFKNQAQSLLCACVLLVSMMMSSYAAKTPHSLITDYRVKQVTYDPNQVFQLVGTYGYQTAIEFAQDEMIKVVTLGDSIAWQTVPYRNRLFIKPVERKAQTNMTVITDKRTYYFKLDSTHATAGITFLVRFHYPDKRMQTGQPEQQVLSDMANVNMDYGTYGDKKTIALKRAFDDGQFTYFLFDQETDIPAIYVVGQDGTESIVNTRREGQYMVRQSALRCVMDRRICV
jgi:type IV secretion system protein VirB9